jgi:hypothetical protein
VAGISGPLGCPVGRLMDFATAAAPQVPASGRHVRIAAYGRPLDPVVQPLPPEGAQIHPSTKAVS